MSVVNEKSFEEKFQIIKENIGEFKNLGDVGGTSENLKYANIIEKFDSFEALQKSQKPNLQPNNRMDCKYWVNILHGICESKNFKPNPKMKLDQIISWYNAPDINQVR